MKKMIRNIVSNLLHIVPREIRFEICRHHANKELAENVSDLNFNGEIWLLENLLPDSHTVFDVGSFTGAWAQQALRINPKIDLHCFEPSQRAFHVLQKKYAAKINCNSFGLGAENSRRPLFVHNGLDEGNSLYLRQGIDYIIDSDLQVKTEDVEIRTLDSYCLEKNIREIDFLKIDVEGHELAVIEGSKDLFDRECIKVTQFEYGASYIEPKILLKDFYDFFDGMNYSIFLLYPSRVHLIPKYDQRLENFQYKNFLVVNNRIAQKKRMFKEACSSRYGSSL